MRAIDVATKSFQRKELPVTIGTDTEFFLQRKDNSNLVFGPALEEAVQELNSYCSAWHVDGCAAEFCVAPGRTPTELLENIAPVMESIEKSNYFISNRVVVDIPSWIKEDLNSRFGQLGCNPDYSHWGYKKSPGMNPDFRSVGFHIHLGDGTYSKTTDFSDSRLVSIRLMDLLIGVPVTKWTLEKTNLLEQEIQRRTLYGDAGSWRPTTYGLEYRVLSSSVFSDTELLKSVFSSSQKIRSMVLQVKGDQLRALDYLTSILVKNASIAINTLDTEFLKRSINSTRRLIEFFDLTKEYLYD